MERRMIVILHHDMETKHLGGVLEQQLFDQVGEGKE
jgi:hypothetical protein